MREGQRGTRMKTSTDTSMRTPWFPKRKRIQRFTREKFAFENLEFRRLLHGHAVNAIELETEDIPAQFASSTADPATINLTTTVQLSQQL